MEKIRATFATDIDLGGQLHCFSRKASNGFKVEIRHSSWDSVGCKSSHRPCFLSRPGKVILQLSLDRGFEFSGIVDRHRTCSSLKRFEGITVDSHDSQVGTHS